MPDRATLRALNAPPPLVIVTDARGNAGYTNRRLEENPDFVVEPSISGWLALVHPEDRAQARADWDAAVRDATSTDRELRLRGPDDEYRWHQCHAAPVVDQQSAVSGWVITCQRVDRFQVDESRPWLTAMVSASDDAIVGETREGIIQSWNSGARRLFGYSEAEVVGQRSVALIPDDRMDEDRGLRDRVLAGERFAGIETVRLTKDGRRVELALTMSPAIDGSGRVIGVLNIARDLSERRRTEANLAAIFNRLPLGIGMTDAEGRVLAVNPAGLRIHGIDSLDDMPSALTSDADHFELCRLDGTSMPIDEWPFARMRRGEAVSGYEVLLRRRDGSDRIVAYDGLRIADSLDGSDVFVFMMTDVTEARKAEAALAASRAELRLVTDYAAVMLVHCDRQSRYLFTNRAYARRFGVDPASLVGQRVPDIIGALAYSAIEPYVQRVLRGELVEFEEELPYASLGNRFMHCVYVPETDAETGKVLGFVAAISDVSDRRRLEEQLREADRRKDEFLAVLGHELRNPLAPMRTGLELLRLSRSRDEIDNVVPMMQRQLGHLVRLVDDLVDVARISRGIVELNRVPLELHHVAEASVELVRPLMQERRHQVVLKLAEEALRVEGDSERLTQVLANLLSNAAKYTQPGGTIELITRRESDQVVIVVRDNGLGIPAQHLERIFEMFGQVPQHRDVVSSRGLGIGLALSRQLIGLHEGSIEARSDGADRGSEFVIRLPVWEGPGTAEVDTSGRPSPSTLERRRILVADDNVDAADGLSMVLNALGHDVQVCYDGVRALEMAEHFSPDLVLLDIGMPKLDGYEVARRMRALPGGKRMFIVALTGWGQVEDKQRAEDAGFDRHLTKPVDVSVLLESIGPALAGGGHG